MSDHRLELNTSEQASDFIIVNLFDFKWILRQLESSGNSHVGELKKRRLDGDGLTWGHQHLGSEGRMRKRWGRGRHHSGIEVIHGRSLDLLR